MKQNTFFFFLKVFEELNHAEKFLRGELHAKPLSYFAELEDGEALRGDPHEGASYIFSQEEIKAKFNDITINPSPIEISASFHMDKLKSLNVFCIYAGYVADPQSIEDVREQLQIPEECFGLGKHAVIIMDVKEFVDRVKRCAKEQNFKSEGRLVGYYDSNTTYGWFDDRDVPFKKRNEFSYQKEFRVVFHKSNDDEEPLDLNIGDLNDIAVYCTPEKINDLLKVEERENEAIWES